MTPDTQIFSKPFLKWAGGKYRLADRIRARLPVGKRLIEPFVGSGSIFLNTDYPEYLLADINGDLIDLFRQLKTNPEDFISDASELFQSKWNTTDAFYALREEFNTTRDKYRKSLLFVYLNRHCFNGLCRYNSKGGFNVPYGKYKQPYFPEKELRAFAIKSQQAEFQTASFESVMASAKFGDVVYCDPPYIPLSDSANFTSYALTGFNMEQQHRLAECALDLRSRGIPVLISNHDTAFARKVYAAAELDFFTVQRNISCDGENRNKVDELLAAFM